MLGGRANREEHIVDRCSQVVNAGRGAAAFFTDAQRRLRGFRSAVLSLGTRDCLRKVCSSLTSSPTVLSHVLKCSLI
jgi:hypothetical protein